MNDEVLKIVKRCEDCKYFWEDRSVGYWECKKEDEMTEEEFEELGNIGDDYADKCKYYEEYYEEDIEMLSYFDIKGGIK